jgi:hypothetical protein
MKCLSQHLVVRARRVTVPKGLFTLQECQDSDGRHSIKFQIISHHHVNVPQLNNYN